MILTLPLLLALPAAAPQGTSPEPAPAATPEQPLDQGEEPPANKPPLRILAETEERVVEALFATSPWLAFERGWREVPAGFGRYHPDAESWWTYLLKSSAADLDAVSSAVLPERRHGDLLWLRTWLGVEATLSLSRSPHRWNPAAYVERAQSVLAGLCDAPGLAPEQRRDRAFEALQELPALWETARRGLLKPSRELTAEAIQRLLDLDRLVQEDLGPRLERAEWAEPVRERFDQLLEEHLRHSLRFRDWLADKPLRVGGPVPPMGAANWESIVRGLTGTELDGARLKSKLLREVSNCDRRLGARRTLPEVPEEERSAEAVAARMSAASRAAVALVLRAGIFEGLALPWGEVEVGARLQPGRTLPGPLVHGWQVEKAQRLIVEGASASWMPGAQATRSGLLSAAAQRALAIRHGFPGEALVRQAAARNASEVERFLWNRATIEGWGLYMLDLTSRLGWVENPLREDEAFQAEVTRLLLVEAARLLASLEIHVQEAPLQAAAEAFRSRTGFDELSSFYEARRALADPLVGIGFVVMLELRGLEGELGGEGRGAGITAMLEPILARPSTRPADLRARLLQERER